MTYSTLIRNLWLPAIALALYLTAIWFRPLMPIDETRYMSVAWEMLLRQGWFQPLTMNFEPYHHKPPLLFWLINLSWSAFGVSRWAGSIPPVLASLSCIYLTAALGKLLFPEILYNRQRIYLIMVASLPFMIYGTLVMFDFMLCVFVLLSLICIVFFSKHRRLRYVVMTGLFLGLGVLTKGPVVYLYVLPIFFLAPLWVKGFSKPFFWYAGCLGAIILSFIPVILWLIPVINASDHDFAFWLIWNQTAGRVTGNFSDAHVRPFYFYLPLIPLMFMPWLFFPSFWRGLSSIKMNLKNNQGLRFLIFWLAPVILAFSLIGGKQPHYLVPLLPGIVLLLSISLYALETRRMVQTVIFMTLLFTGGQVIASQNFFKSYELQPLADIIHTDPERDLAFVRNYHAEIGFLARREHPVDDKQMDEIDEWFKQHPKGWAIIRYKEDQEVKSYGRIADFPYRGKRLGIFEKTQ